MLSLGNALTHLKKFEEAERHILSAHQGLVAQTTTESARYHRDVKASCEIAAEQYEAWDKPEKAKQFRKEAEN